MGPVKGELELCSLGDSLSICQGARHAAEDAVVDLDHLVDGLGRDILPKEKDGAAVTLQGARPFTLTTSLDHILTLPWKPGNLSQ